MDLLSEAVEDLLAHQLVALSAFGVVADHEPVAVGAIVDADLLDTQVARHRVVAALAGERRACFLTVRAQLLADDVVTAATLQVAAVALGGEPAVKHPDHPGEVPAAQVIANLADDHLVRRVAGERPHPDRDPLASDRHPDDHLGQVGTVILAVLGVATSARLHQHRLLIGLVGVGRVVVVLQLIWEPVGLPIGRGRVKEQQVNLEIKQRCHREEHPLLQLGQHGVQEVHRPIAGIIGDPGQPLDERPLRDPAAAGELRQRPDRQAVGDHREDRPLHRLVLESTPGGR